MRKVMPVIAMLALLTVGCSRQDTADYAERVEDQFKTHADLNDVDVSEDKDKNTLTLSGNVHTEDAKQRAEQIAKQTAPNRVVANEIGVRPEGMESEARSIDNNLDDAIDKNFKAALIASRLDNQVDYKVENGVVTLTGKVKNPQDRQKAQQVASNIPNVQQVINQIEIER